MRVIAEDRHIFFDVHSAHTGWRDRELVERPVLVAVHGGPGIPHIYFRPWLSLLAERYCLVYLDQCGSGWSSRLSGSGYPMSGFVQDMELVRSALGVDQIVPIGHSFGGAVAMEYALTHPAHVSALVLANTIAGMDIVRRQTQTNQPSPAAEASAPITDLMTQLVAAHLANDGPALADLDTHQAWPLLSHTQFQGDLPALHTDLASATRFGAEAYMAASGAAAIGLPGAALADWNILDRLSGISAPTLVVASDSATEYAASPDAHARPIAAAIPAARLEVLADRGHYPFAEDPQQFARLVDGFLTDIGQPGAESDATLLRRG